MVMLVCMVRSIGGRARGQTVNESCATVGTALGRPCIRGVLYGMSRVIRLHVAHVDECACYPAFAVLVAYFRSSNV